MTTTAQLIKEIRKPGKVFVPMLVPGDVAYVAAEKADLIDYLTGGEGPAPLMVLKRDDSGLYLDAA